MVFVLHISLIYRKLRSGVIGKTKNRLPAIMASGSKLKDETSNSGSTNKINKRRLPVNVDQNGNNSENKKIKNKVPSLSSSMESLNSRINPKDQNLNENLNVHINMDAMIHSSGTVETNQENMSKNNHAFEKRNVNLETKDPICDIYYETDLGPFYVHVSPNGESNNFGDMAVGRLLRTMKVQGVMEVKKINRFTVKLRFDTFDKANSFLTSPFLVQNEFKAFLPRYNITKIGIIFDIPVEYSEQMLKDNIDSPLPIVDIHRFQRNSENERGEKVRIPTRTVKVSFRGQFLPDEVSFFYAKRKVKPFIPTVTRCNRCLRFGHIVKFCKQEKSTCVNCGIIHEDECESPMKCFHCHSPNHDAKNVNCPEFMRNTLIKEAMVYRNLTFFEANEEFPKVKSQFSLAEQMTNFPTIQEAQSRKFVRKEPEKTQPSFPRKSDNELRLDYNQYVNTQRGTSNANPSVNVVSSVPVVAKVSHPPGLAGVPDEIVPELVTTLKWILGEISNVHGTSDDIKADMLLIKISERIQNLMQGTSEREMVNYASIADEDEASFSEGFPRNL